MPDDLDKLREEIERLTQRLSEQYKIISVLKDKNEELVLEHLSCPHAAEVRNLQARLSAAQDEAAERGLIISELRSLFSAAMKREK